METEQDICWNQIAEAGKTINEMGTTVFLSEQKANMALMITRRGYVMETGRSVLAELSENPLKDETVKKAYLGLYKERTR